MAREYWMLVSRCGECNEPIPVDLISVLGNNEIGIDGHTFRSKVDAEGALTNARMHVAKHGVYRTVIGSDDIVRYDMPQRKRYSIPDLDHVEAVRVEFHGLE